MVWVRVRLRDVLAPANKEGTDHAKRKNKLRYNEYYDMQHIYDELYAQSKNGNNFYKLLEIIGSEQNICLAYRNLKSNSGSKNGWNGWNDDRRYKTTQQC